MAVASVREPAQGRKPNREREADAPLAGVVGKVMALLQGDLGLLLLLIILTAALRTGQIARTEVTSSDSLAFIQYAWQLEHEPWQSVLRGANRHPGYPVAILAVARPVRYFVDGPDPWTMQLSAQLASAVASVLLIVPLFYLGRELFDRFVGFWAAMLFQCLPASSEVLADGLSEGVFLLFAVTGLLAAARGLRGGRAAWFVLCGVCGGLAYLTRPEGALVVAATAVVLLGCQAVPAWRRSWTRLLACGLGLSAAALAVGGPYVAVTGRLTVKPTVKALTSPFAEDDDAVSPGESARLSRGRTGAGRTAPLVAPTWAVWWPGGDTNRSWWGLWAVTQGMVEGYFYVAWLPALLGLWWFRDRFRLVPGAWVLLVVCLILLLLLWRVAAALGYVSERHLLLVILCGTYWVVAGVRELPVRLAVVLGRWSVPSGTWISRLAESRFIAPVLLALLVAAGLPKNLAPLHAEQAGFRAAGAWLAAHSGPTDTVIDPYRWAAYYAGKLLPKSPADSPPRSGTQYVVLPARDAEHPRRPQVAPALRLAARGKEVYRTPPSGRRGRGAEVVVYAVPGPTAP